MTCSKCKADSPLQDLFKREQMSFRRGIRMLCPRCKNLDERRLVRFYLILITASSIIVAGVLLFTDKAQHDPQGLWVAEFGALFWVFQLVSIIPHELGHAFAGWVCGLEIGTICLGRGKLVASGTFRGVRLEMRLLPIVGVVTATTDNMRAWRLRRIIFIAAGPLTNLLLLLLAIHMGALVGNPFSTTEATPVALVWAALALANLVLVLNSLFGRQVATSVGTVRSDGRQLFDLLFKPLPSMETRRATYRQSRAWKLLAENRFADALAFLKPALIDFPTDAHLHAAMAHAQLMLRTYASGRNTIINLLITHTKRDAMRAMLSSNLAWADLMLDSADLMDEAEAASQEAWNLTPWEPSIRSTRGLMLIERGKIRAGIELLETAIPDAETAYSKGCRLCSLAIARFRLSEPAAGKSLLTLAEQVDPNCEMLERVRRLALLKPAETESMTAAS